MNAFLTAAAFVVLIAAAAYVIHRLNIQHADRIAVHRYSVARPGRRGRGTPLPPVVPDGSESPTAGERRNHRDGAASRHADTEAVRLTAGDQPVSATGPAHGSPARARTDAYIRQRARGPWSARGAAGTQEPRHLTRSRGI